MIAGTIWNQLVTTLKGSPKLNYFKFVYEGRRFDLEPKALPCVMLEPVADGEPDRRLNNIDDQFFEVNLYAFSSNDLNSFKNTIVGDQNYKGILGINNDIRAVLKDSYSLGRNVIDTRIQATQFDVEDEAKYPVRGLLMPLRILYRQQDGK
jgi:hypothetical protein